MKIGRVMLLGAAIAIATSCQRDPTGQTCVGALEIELPTDEVLVGDIFSATATHRLEECISDLSWQASGSVSLEEGQGQTATFRANTEGTGTITVRNNKGNQGQATVEVGPVP
jgi:hypothetical protein